MPVSEAVSLLVNESQVNPKIEGPVFLGIKLKESPHYRPQHQPTLIQLPHKTRRTDETTVCFVVEDPSVPIREAITKSKLTEGLFDEIIGIKKLRKRVIGRKAANSTKGAERFAKAFTIIYVQSEVQKELIDLLGNEYFKRPRHIPIPVVIDEPMDSEQWLRELRYLVKSTSRAVQLVLKPQATYASMRVGHTKMGQEKLAQNVEAAIEAVKRKTPHGLGHTAEYEIQTAESMSLSI